MVDPDVLKNKPGAADHSTDKKRHMVGLDVLRSDLRADGEICAGPTPWPDGGEKIYLLLSWSIGGGAEKNGEGAEKTKNLQ